MCYLYVVSRSTKRMNSGWIIPSDYLPVYFQASKTASPTRSGVDLFGLAWTIAPLAIITGASVQIFNRYRPQNYLGWMLMTIGFGLLSTLNENSTTTQYIGFQVILGTGLGMIWVGTQFPILAPLPFSNNAHALAFFTFIRCFAQVRTQAQFCSLTQSVS
jgi:hypothetical protein